jgi:hypothetical protein
MPDKTMSSVIQARLEKAAHALHAADPRPVVGAMLDRAFPLPPGSPQYAANTLTPGAVPCEPSYSEREPGVLRFTIEPIGAGTTAGSRQQEATNEMRRLVFPHFGRDALRWFDQRSEDWRGVTPRWQLQYGAWFGTAFDHDGLSAAKVYYELHPSQIDALPPTLKSLVTVARETMPSLVPIFTSIHCTRYIGSQRVTFLQNGPLRLADLGPLMQRLGLAHQLPSLMQVVGVALGGRFELPERSVLIGVRETPDGLELKLEVMLGMIADLPPTFLDLLALALAERPRELQGLGRWLRAFTPETADWPGNFSVLSIRTTPGTPARVSLYLRPAEFELQRRLSDVPALGASAAMAAVS